MHARISYLTSKAKSSAYIYLILSRPNLARLL